MRDSRLIEQMLEYCGRAAGYANEAGIDGFYANTLYQDACAKCVENIGELAGKLSGEFRSEHAEIPWAQIRNMRNVVVHDYGGVDVGTLWETIQDDLPQLMEFCTDITAGNRGDNVPEL